MNPWRGLKNLPREVWILCAANLVNRAGTMVLPFLVLYLARNLGVPPGRAALALTLYGAGSLITAPLSGRLSTVVHKFAHVFSQAARVSERLSLQRRAARSFRVNCHSKGWAIVW